jgi:hypothetical protein
MDAPVEVPSRFVALDVHRHSTTVAAQQVAAARVQTDPRDALNLAKLLVESPAG